MSERENEREDKANKWKKYKIEESKNVERSGFEESGKLFGPFGSMVLQSRRLSLPTCIETCIGMTFIQPRLQALPPSLPMLSFTLSIHLESESIWHCEKQNSNSTVSTMHAPVPNGVCSNSVCLPLSRTHTHKPEYTVCFDPTTVQYETNNNK